MRKLLGLAALSGAWLLAGTGAARAQNVMTPELCTPQGRAELGIPADAAQYKLCSPGSNFRLSGAGDFAGAFLRPQNPNIQFFVTNAGPGDSEGELRQVRAPFYAIGSPARPTTWRLEIWRYQWAAAVSRTDWLRNREIAPSLRNVIGGGYTAIHNEFGNGGLNQWQAADGSVGRLHSGVQSAQGAGCRDTGSPFGYPYGFPMLAVSDCPESWGSAGWIGRRWVGPIENWQAWFRDVGPSTFQFDVRRIPEEYWQTTDRPLTVGDNVQAFGAGSDWGAENRPRYGKVIPGQNGDPAWQGYPIGLTVTFNSYSFKVPAVAGGFIHEALVINDSEKVYGVPLDYDSVWFGLQYGPNNTSHQVIPEMGVAVHVNGGVDEIRVGCGAAGYVKPVSGVGACSTSSTTRGFRGGAHAIMVLQSPIGDLRNKHFSNPESPFYAPNHPHAGDTITMNRYGWCDYLCTGLLANEGARAMYGQTVGDPVAALNGRDVRTLTNYQRKSLFNWWYNDQGTEIYCNTAAPRDPGCYGWVVPGGENFRSSLTLQPTPTWTYTNRPPGAPVGPDTLIIDICRPATSVGHPERNRCPVLFTDSVADGSVNNTIAGFWQTAGPFPLKANDTVPFTMATFAGVVPAEWYKIVNDRMMPGPILEAWYNFYVNDFYLGPSQPPPPGIVNVGVRGGASQFGDTGITLYLDNAAEAWRDKYTVKFIQDLRNPAPGTFAAQIAVADPQAANKLLALMDKNIVDTVYIYKSCDLSRSWTASGNQRCDPAPLRTATGAPTGSGWQAYAFLVPNAQGRFAKTWTDNNVTGGIRYRYTMVAVTKGVQFPTRYRTTAGVDRDTVLQIITPGQTPFGFSSSNPWAAEVYVPLSAQAGAELARSDLQRDEGSARWYRQGNIFFFGGSVQAGSYRLVFGRDAEIREYRRTGAQNLDSTVVLLRREAQALMPNGSIQRVNIPDQRYHIGAGPGIAMSGDTAMRRTTQSIPGGTVQITNMNRKSGLLLDAGTGQVLFASGFIPTACSVTSETCMSQFTPPDYTAHPVFRHFLVGVTDAAIAYEGATTTTNVTSTGSRISGLWYSQGVSLRPEGTGSGGGAPSVVQVTGAANFASTQVRYGTWEFTFGAPFYGREADIPVYNVNDRQGVQEAYTAMLNRRAAVSRTDASAAALTAVQRGISPTLTANDLIEVGLPFTVTNLDHGSAPGVGSPVRVAMLRSNKRATALLGNFSDTVTVTVPDNVWIPGEPLILLEEVELARTNADGSVVLNAAGDPEVTRELRVTVSQLTLGCVDPQPRITCNPIRAGTGIGSGSVAYPGYVDVRPVGDSQFPDGWSYRLAYRDMITSRSVFEFSVAPPRVGRTVASVDQSMLDRVRVVPNPYIVVSSFNYVADVRRISFTSLPPSGSIHILTISGQYVQRLDWEPEDLSGTGDLVWQMNTKEGTEITSGVYMYVVETVDPATGNKLSKTGKFAIIK